MHTKLTDTICYRLDSELKSKLLKILKNKNVSLSNFHRYILLKVLVTIGRTENSLALDERGSEC
jgi:hypothetical protein